MTKHLFKPCGGGFFRTLTLAAFALVALAISVALSVVLATPSTALAADAGASQGSNGTAATLTRLAGEDADQTAAAISQAGFESSECAILARMDDFADALGASGLAGALDCPILLTGSSELSEAAAEELERLGVKQVYIIGGCGALFEQIDTDLNNLGVKFTRIYGDYAWDTSLACAVGIEKLQENEQSEVIVAMSSNFQDALSISSYAYKYHVPLILETSEAQLTEEAVAFINDTEGTIYVPGGPGAVPTSSVEDVFDGRTIQRLYGTDGYDTSNQIATYMTEHGLLSANAVAIASGARAAHGVDALAGAALIGKQGGVMLLANGNDKTEDENYTTIDAGEDSEQDASYLLANKDNVVNAYVLGGEVVAPSAFFNKVQQILYKAAPEKQALPTDGWSLSPATYTYTGTAITPTVVAPSSLKEGTDFKVSCTNNTNVGTATVTITGIGNYEGTATLKFTIVPRDISDGILTFVPENVTYTGSTIHMPDSMLMLDGVNVPSFDDDVLNWEFDANSESDATEVGTYTVRVKGLGNYTGQTEGTWNIVGIPLDTATVSVQNPTYNGSEQEITPVVKLGETTLTKDVDYKIAEGSDAKATNVSATNYTVTIEGIGKYAGSVSQTWNITPLDITNNDSVTVTLSEDSVAYDGEAHTQTATVKFGSTTLTQGTDFTVSGQTTATEIGTYTLAVTGTGNFTGSKNATWDIHEATNYYWLAAANATNPEDESGILKNQTQIDKDMKVLHGEDSDAKDAVEQEWTNYMNGKSADGTTDQEVRLYTKWYGSDAGTGANQWVEFRIIQVGEHDSDGSAVTFMATHSLPTAQSIFGANEKNIVGWSGSTLRVTMNDEQGYVMKGLANLKDSVKPICKLQATYNAETKWSQAASPTDTPDTFWVLSHNELTGLGEAWKTVYPPEGTQYSWFEGKVTNGNAANDAIANTDKTRASASPKSSDGTSWWLRTPNISGSSSFGVVKNDGNPYASGQGKYNVRSVVPCFAM